MGKQTKQKGSHFGGDWTIQKLHIIEEYLKVYATVLKNQNVKKIYVDGFAGSGKTELKTKSGSDEEVATVVDGSALLSLKYNFDEYYFLELDPERLAALQKHVQDQYPNKLRKVHFITGDCNEKLLNFATKVVNAM